MTRKTSRRSSPRQAARPIRGRGRPRQVPQPPGERGAAEPFALASLPFDLYQRHKLIQEALGRIREGRRRLKILDVGGSPGHLRPFLPRDRVVVVDREGEAGQVDLRGEGFRLPFADRSFDVVVTLDTLEHLSARRRPAFLRELARVTGDALLVTAPFAGAQVEEAEAILDAFLSRRLKLDHRFLQEHSRYGLPRRERTRKLLAKHVGPVTELPNGNLDRWLLMMGLSFYLDADPALADLKRQVSAYYNRNYYRGDNSAPAYRWLLAARREPGRPLETAGLVSAPGDDARVDFSPMAALMEATGVDLLKEAYGSIATLQGQLGDKDVHAANLVAERDHRQRLIDGLQAEISRRQERIDALRAELESKSEALGKRERRIFEIHREIGELRGAQGKVAELQADLDRERSAGESLRREVERLARHSENLDRMLAHKEEHSANLVGHAKNLEALLDRKAKHNEGLIAHAENLNALLRRQMESHAAQAGDLSAVLRKQSEGLDASVQGLAREVGRFADQAELLQQREAQLRELQGKVGELEAAAAKRGEGDAALRADLEHLSATLAVRGNHIAGLERHAANLEEEIDRRQRRVDVLEKEVEVRSERIAHLEKHADALEEARERLRRRVADLEEHAGYLDDRAGRLARQVKLLGVVIDTKQQALAEVDAQADRFRRDKERLADELSDARRAARDAVDLAGIRGRALDDARSRIEAQLRTASGLRDRAEAAESLAAERDRMVRALAHRADRAEARLRREQERTAERDREVAERQGRIAELDASLREKIEYAAALEASLKDSSARLEAARGSLRAESRKSAELADRLRALRDRRAVRLLRRLGVLRDPD